MTIELRLFMKSHFCKDRFRQFKSFYSILTQSVLKTLLSGLGRFKSSLERSYRSALEINQSLFLVIANSPNESHLDH
jgi:hypothetical protein